jgi:tetratricopeptide (TPR) repeat protein
MSEAMLRVRLAKVLRKRAKSEDTPEKRRSLLRDCLSEASRAVVKDPLNPYVRREVGKAHFALGQHAEALDIWRQTLALTPNDPYLCFKMGLSHWHLGRDGHDRDVTAGHLTAARSYFDQSCLLFGLECIEERAWAQLWRGRTALEQGFLNDAVHDLRSSAASAGAHDAACILLAEAYGRGGNEAASHRLFSQALGELRSRPGRRCLDEGWGGTVSWHEAFAWAGRAVAISAITDLPPSARLELLNEALAAAENIPDDHGRAFWIARCLDAQGRIRSRDDLEGAVDAVEHAGGHYASPEFVIHLLELYETQAKRQHDAIARLAIVEQAERAVSTLERLPANGDRGWTKDASKILARLRASSPPPYAQNGHARS